MVYLPEQNSVRVHISVKWLTGTVYLYIWREFLKAPEKVTKATSLLKNIDFKHLSSLHSHIFLELLAGFYLNLKLQ